MMTFAYKALTAAQRMIKGEIQALDEAEAVKKIRSLSLLPLDVKARVKSRALKQMALFKPKTIKKEELMVAMRELSVMLSAGIPILRALRILIDGNKDKVLGDVLDRVYEDTKKGESLGSALENARAHFSDTIISMVRTGEKSGELPQVLLNISRDLEHSLLIESEVKNALAYPAFLLGMSGLALAFIFTVVIPKFTVILEKLDVQLPVYSRLLLSSGSFVKKYLYIFAGLLLLLLYALRRLSKRPEVKYFVNRTLLKAPIFRNLILEIDLSRFSHALAVLLGSGVDIVHSLRMSVEAMGNRFLRKKFADVGGRLKRGESLNRAIQAVGLFPSIAVNMIEVGEETGKLPEILEEISVLYMERFRTAMKRAISLLEPVIITIVGIVIGFIVISLISAIMSLNEIRF